MPIIPAVNFQDPIAAQRQQQMDASALARSQSFLNNRWLNRAPQINVPKGPGVGAGLQRPTFMPGGPTPLRSGVNPTAGGTTGGGGGDLMGLFRSLLGKESTYNPYSAKTTTYARSPEMGGAFSHLQNLASTGGLSQEEIASMRARGISPIRAIYGNLQRGLERNRALSGGYSPNFAAASARMGREMSEQIAGKTTDVEAELAKLAQTGRIAAASPLANLAQSETELMNKIGLENTQAQNLAAQTNAAKLLEAQQGNISNKTDILKGMTQLFGTTPGQAENFGNQVMNPNQMIQALLGAMK